MNILELKDVTFNPPANVKEMHDVESRIALPSDFKEILRIANGFILDDGVKVYSTHELVERNETFEVEKYASGYLAIGDDSGGRCILISLSSGEVGIVGQGSMNPKYMEFVARTLQEWIDNSCHI